MLINCKPGCKGKKATTEAHLNLKTDEVECEFCGDTIEVSSFVKNSMKQRGDVVKKDDRKSFQFKCLTCNEIVETEVNGIKLKGIKCSNDCNFEVSKFTIYAMKKLKSGKNKG